MGLKNGYAKGIDRYVFHRQSTRGVRVYPYPRVRVGSGSWNARPAHLYSRL